jgi:hypothetical protein
MDPNTVAFPADRRGPSKRLDPKEILNLDIYGRRGSGLDRSIPAPEKCLLDKYQ